MSRPAAIQGTYFDLKFIKTRKLRPGCGRDPA
jgi:hypothetical protein